MYVALGMVWYGIVVWYGMVSCFVSIITSYSTSKRFLYSCFVIPIVASHILPLRFTIAMSSASPTIRTIILLALMPRTACCISGSLSVQYRTGRSYYTIQCNTMKRYQIVSFQPHLKLSREEHGIENGVVYCEDSCYVVLPWLPKKWNNALAVLGVIFKLGQIPPIIYRLINTTR